MTVRPGPRLRLARALCAVAIAMLLPACSFFVQYTDELDDRSSSGRSAFVTTPATLGGSAGFIVGIPADIGLLPVTYPIYLYQKSVDPLTADPLSTLLFPSFVCWRLGKFVLGAPFDVLEYAFYRGWQGERTRTRAEREAIEFEYDQEALPNYPVEPIYPLPNSDGVASRSSS